MISTLKPNPKEIKEFISHALKEDLGSGDITTESILKSNDTSSANVLAKESMTLCGVDLFGAVFQYLDPTTQINFNYKDGDVIQSGSIIFFLKGSSFAILKGERTALNLIQHLSGIATKTRVFVDKAKPVKILDTRKTHPGIRRFEKYAVACGGGENHRMGLFDKILIKDNHIQVAGGVSKAVERLHKTLGSNVFIEVEVANLKEVRAAVESKVNRILLDNMSIQSIRQAVEIINGRSEIEVSGSITLDKLDQLSHIGIDFVSIGCITHSAPWVDISLNII